MVDGSAKLLLKVGYRCVEIERLASLRQVGNMFAFATDCSLREDNHFWAEASKFI
jgi:hypothetical protein